MKRTDVFCKVCGQPLRKYTGGTVYHCENNDMAHRGLIPADVVERAPRYAVVFDGVKRGYVTKKQMINAVGKKVASRAEKIQKILV
jgi:hypothetical protein